MSGIARDGGSDEVVPDSVKERHVAPGIGKHLIGILAGPLFIEDVAVSQVLDPCAARVEEFCRNPSACCVDLAEDGLQALAERDTGFDGGARNAVERANRFEHAAGNGAFGRDPLCGVRGDQVL